MHKKLSIIFEALSCFPLAFGSRFIYSTAYNATPGLRWALGTVENGRVHGKRHEKSRDF